MWSSKYCKIADPRTLMYGFDLPSLLSLKKYIDISEAFDYAHFKDEENNRPKNNP